MMLFFRNFFSHIPKIFLFTLWKFFLQYVSRFWLFSIFLIIFSPSESDRFVIFFFNGLCASLSRGLIFIRLWLSSIEYCKFFVWYFVRTTGYLYCWNFVIFFLFFPSSFPFVVVCEFFLQRFDVSKDFWKRHKWYVIFLFIFSCLEFFSFRRIEYICVIFKNNFN